MSLSMSSVPGGYSGFSQASTPPIGLSNTGATTMPSSQSYGDPFQSQQGASRNSQSSSSPFQNNADGSVSIASPNASMGNPPGGANQQSGGHGWKFYSFVGLSALYLFGGVRGHGWKNPVRTIGGLFHMMSSPKREAKKAAKLAASKENEAIATA